MLKTIRKLLGIKTYIEIHSEAREQVDILQQKWHDEKFLNAIKDVAFKRFLDWQKEQEIIKKLDKEDQLWRMRIPLRYEWQVTKCYHVSHIPTAKYLNVDLESLINREFELLKLTTHPHPRAA